MACTSHCRWRSLLPTFFLVILGVAPLCVKSATTRKATSLLSLGATANDVNSSQANTEIMNKALLNAEAGDEIVVDAGYTFYINGGIVAQNKHNLTLRIDGILSAVPDFDKWPKQVGGAYAHIFDASNCSFLTITGKGMVDGQGKAWWDRYVFGPCGFLQKKPCAHRPKAIYVEDCTDVLVEGIISKNSPSFNIDLNQVLRAEVRYVTITTEREHIQRLKAHLRTVAPPAPTPGFPNGLQPEDLNTDGIDPSGRDVWIHHVVIYNDDDSIAVKPSKATSTFGPCSENMLIEDSIISGFGLSIGSVPPNVDHNCVRNITFRNISMPKTGKGVYVKSNPECSPGATAEITDITYEDIRMDKPEWWAVWIGPQQQQEPGSKLGDKCSLEYPIQDHCPTQGCVTFTNITLRNINITDPILSPGIILGNSTNPMKNIVFDNVVATFDNVLPIFPYGADYKCENAHGVATGGTSPVPPCFQSRP
eukprot:m.1129577 g.1129577  ORF g.1129577 m.1129577 type:complete len:478 (-) comp24420_c0_seq11:3449-4882(-)